MTADLALPDAPTTDDGPMTCYRHPDRETWVRCGRCVRPICTRCAMQGPVGMRCKDCGKPVRDALASLRPTQVAIALALAIGGGMVLGYVGLQLGIFTIIVAFFGGGLIADAIDRAVGIKRSSGMLVIVLGGILVGGLLGSGLGAFMLWREFAEFADEADQVPLLSIVADAALWSVIAIGAALAAAYGRMR